MALDYTKLSDAELQAIANNDYTKLSDATLQALSKEDESEKSSVNAIPQAIGVAKNIGPEVYNVANQVTKGGVRDIAQIGGILYNNATPAKIGQALTTPIDSLKQFGSAYLEGHPWAGSTLKQGVTGAVNSAKNIATGIGAGLAAPESAFAAPYQMAAYEQEKIRANPNAPEYKTTPYAQQYRGEASTQGAAGAANRRNAIAGQQYGGISADDQARLEDDRMKRMVRYAAAKKALGL